MEAKLNSLPIIDNEEGLQLAGNNQALANDLLALLIKGLPTDLASIQQAHSNNNETDLRKHLHKLRGGVAYCGLPRLKTVLATLDDSIKSHQPQETNKLLSLLADEIKLLLTHYAQQV